MSDYNSSQENDSAPNAIAAETLNGLGIKHGFYGRIGGVSGGIYTSLNCGRGSKDDRVHIEQNRARVAAHMGVPATHLIGPRQAHTARVVAVHEPWRHDAAPEADGVVTAARGIAIGVLSADCAPLIMADTVQGVIAAVHAGWKGAKAGIAEAAVDAMESIGGRRDRIIAAIGPAISVSVYEVGDEFRDAFLSDDIGNAVYFLQTKSEARPYFDLKRYLKDRLVRAGLRTVSVLPHCTYQNESLFFSHRRSVHHGEADYGRQISAIVIP